ncbi:hypothetical protein HELRODRAFT_158474 [Helobdella robusta]|uniref:Uncharacterized protein n=1 Tax=Helobdella robusta TaxID=6412 RepID=T1EMU4_HELRO|nr:hypothetical protein HELRODRAFT_158474 [Helobdella robusta]ESO12066.1 hypothetical protein HELRODRAFT_158474 [Helobdella robusta]
MSNRPHVISDFIYFLINNVHCFDNEVFASNVVDFYRVEEVVAGVEILKDEIDIMKTNNLKNKPVEKFQFRGIIKKDKIQDCINFLKILTTNGLLDNCSVFVSPNLARIPTVLNWLNCNFQMIKNDIKAMLNIQRKVLIDTMDVNNKSLLDSLCNIVSSRSINNREINYAKACSANMPVANDSVSNCTTPCVVLKSNSYVANTVTAVSSENVKVVSDVKPKKNWHDSTAQSSQCESHDDEFQPVLNKKRKKSAASPWVGQMNQPTPNVKLNKPSKVFGTGADCPLKSSKVIEKKITYYIGNVQSCTKDVIENHLKSNDIAFPHCFPVVRKRNPKVNTGDIIAESTAFKIILPVNELTKLKNPDIWPNSEINLMFHQNGQADLLEVVDHDLNILNDYSYVCSQMLPENNRSGNVGGGVGLFVRNGLSSDVILFLRDLTFLLLKIKYGSFKVNNVADALHSSDHNFGYRKYIDSGVSDSFVLFECLPHEIIDVVKNLKNTHSCGDDFISNFY